VGFLSAVGQVIANQKTFKQWEKEDANKQAQRDVLTQNGLSRAELQNAANKGKVIMDVIDIMDTHSEEVAENTETAIMPIAQSLPSLASLLAVIGTAKFYIEPHANIHDKAYKNFINSPKGKELTDIILKLKENIKNNPENNPLSEVKIGAPGFLSRIMGNRLTEITPDNISGKLPEIIFSKKNMSLISQSGDKEVKALHTRLTEIAKEFQNTKGIKNNSMGKILGKSAALIGGISAFVFVAANIVAAKLQVKSSRIARWQSREDLKDPKYFVQYTEEQIAEAQRNADANKKEEKKGFSLFKKPEAKGMFKYSNNNSFFKSLRATVKDSKNYDEWKANYNLEDKKVKRNLTQEELEEAEREQEVLQRVTKIINNKAEEYSENMETTAGVLIGGTPYLGLGIGAIINTFITKTGLGEKFSDKKFEKILSKVKDNDKKEELKTLYEKLKAPKNKADKSLTGTFDGINNIKVYIEKLFSALDFEALDKKGGLSAMYNKAKEALNAAMTTKIARNTAIGLIGSLITGTVGAFIGLKLQKSAARAGRYTAKRELEENSANFIGYTKEEFDKVNDIKAEKKPVLKRLGDYLMFIPKVLKEYFDYEKYKKTQADNDKALLEELTKLEVTDKQLKDAKELQRKLFTTFESVDDKSQEYSEAIEAVTEMSQPLLPYIGMVITAIPIAIGATRLVKKGGAGAAESITGFFAKHTRFLKGKVANKYVDGVTNNIRGIVERQKISGSPTDKVPFAKIMELFPETGDGGKLMAAVREAIESSKGKENELEAALKALADNPLFKKSVSREELVKAIEDCNKNFNSYAQKIFEMMGVSSEEKIDLDLMKIAEPYLDDVVSVSDVLNKLIKSGDIPNVKISEIASKLSSLNVQGIKGFKGIDEFKNALKSNNITGIINAVAEGKIKTGEWRKIVSELTEQMQDNGLKKMLNGIIKSSMTDEQALKIFQNIQTILKHMPKEELSKIIDVAIEEFTKNPAKFMQALQNGQFKSVLLTRGLAAGAAAAPVAWGALTMLITYVIESVFASMQKQAGRLGVMKAFEELQDVRFYANMEPSTEETTPNKGKSIQKQNTAQTSFSSSNIKNVNELFNQLRQR